MAGCVGGKRRGQRTDAYELWGVRRHSQKAGGGQGASALVPPPIWIILFTPWPWFPQLGAEAVGLVGLQVPFQPGDVSTYQRCVTQRKHQGASTTLKSPGGKDSRQQRRGRGHQDGRGQFFLLETELLSLPSSPVSVRVTLRTGASQASHLHLHRRRLTTGTTSSGNTVTSHPA